MNYTEQYSQLRNLLINRNDPDREVLFRNIHILESEFHSDFYVHLNSRQSETHNSLFEDNLRNIHTNAHFKYPIIRPKSHIAGSEAIILLHGLNKRSWDKYLPWAYSLA